MIQTDRLVTLFKELCSIDSPALAEAEVVAFVRKRLETMGLDVWEDDAGAKIGGNANNLIARLSGNRSGAPKIFLSAHFDTVEPTAGLRIVECDGTLYSDGTTILGADDKGGMSPAIEAVQAILESGEPHGDVYLLFSCAEEIGLKGAGALDIQSLGLDYGFVLDTGPPVGSFVVRTGNHDRIDVEFVGKPAHAGKDPEKGINAIQVAAEAISGMKLGRIGPETTSNFGIISGGTAVNVVCPSVRLRGEARSTSLAELEAQVDHMILRCQEAAQKWGAEVRIDHERHYLAYSLDESAPVVTVAQAASRSLGFDPGLRTTLGGSDANIYNQKGVPSIVVGTGMEKIHTHEEFIKISDLAETARLAYALILFAAR